MNFNTNRSTFLFFLFFIVFIFPSVAQNKSERLFHIERNKNQHIVCYDLNIVDGKIDDKKPILIYWISHPQKEKSDLSFIENKMAYGAKSRLMNPNTVVIKMNALKEPEIKVSYDPVKQEPVTIAAVNGKTLKLEKIYIVAKAPVYTSVERVEIHGISTSTGKKIVEIIKG